MLSNSGEASAIVTTMLVAIRPLEIRSASETVSVTETGAQPAKVVGAMSICKSARSMVMGTVWSKKWLSPAPHTPEELTLGTSNWERSWALREGLPDRTSSDMKRV